MAEFIVRLSAASAIRLGSKPYDDEASRRSLLLKFPDAQIAIFDNLKDYSIDVQYREGLIIQVKIAATDIDSAITLAVGVASYALSLLCCVSLASAGTPIPIWAYDATANIENREYRYCCYDGVGPAATRALNDQNFAHLVERNYDSFLKRTDVKEDFKNRVQRSMMSFRRGISDNEDVLSEFLTAWSTMEGLDCVYTKLLPAPTVRQFKDGMKDVLRRLGRPAG